MSQLQRRIDEAKRAFLATVLEAVEEEAIELVHRAFASAMSIQPPDAISASVVDVTRGHPVANTGACSVDTQTPSRAAPGAVRPAVVAACPRVAACIATHPGISTREVAAELGMHAEKVRRVLRVLTLDGVVHFHTLIEPRGGRIRSYFPVVPAPNNGATIADVTSVSGFAPDLDPAAAPLRTAGDIGQSTTAGDTTRGEQTA